MNFAPLFAALLALSAGIGYLLHPTVAPIAGATLPSGTAVFETSLQSAITSSATTMTLAANAVRGGGSLSGYNCFTVDEGSAQAETICGTVSGTTVSSLTRGLSQATGTSTVTALQFAHRRGANVKITDFPLIQILKALANGEDTYPNILSYTTHPTFANATDLVDKSYVDALAFGGIPAASDSASGFVEMATALEAASSTNTGSTAARLALGANIATSTYNSATAGLKVVMTQNGGQIDPSFVENGSPAGSITAYASSTAPSGWLLANGQSVSRTTYARLFAVIGTTYGAGNGSTTFTLPDITGKSIVMASSTQTALDGLNRSTLGAIGTTTSHTQTLAELVPHTHTTPALATNSTGSGSGAVQLRPSTDSTLTLNSTGSGAAFNTLDPYIIMYYIIKY